MSDISVYCVACSQEHTEVGDLVLDRTINLPPEHTANGDPVSIVRKIYHAVCPESLVPISLIVDQFNGGIETKEYTIVKGEI